MPEIDREGLKAFLAPFESFCGGPGFRINPRPFPKEQFDNHINKIMSLLGIITQEDLTAFLGTEAEEFNKAKEKGLILTAWLERLYEAADGRTERDAD
jgi:hypothetical protein